jgi:hypothetical protein
LAAWNEDSGLVVVETVQFFHGHFSPFKMAPARLVTNVTLERDEDTKLWYIAYQVCVVDLPRRRAEDDRLQEDFYHPDHFMNLLFPPLVPFIRLFLWMAVFMSGLLA